jgi:hypothetical protein
MRLRIAVCLAAGVALVLVAGCAEPEQTNFATTIASLTADEVCVVGEDLDATCFPSDRLDLPDGVEPHLDDCVGVETASGDRSTVVAAGWNGRCAAEPVELGVELRAGRPVVVLPECLGSLVAFRIEDPDGEPQWWVRRETSTEHPLLTAVTLDELPPGFAVSDPWLDPPPDVELTAIASQQAGLPPSSVTFTLGELEDDPRPAGGCRTP